MDSINTHHKIKDSHILAEYVWLDSSGKYRSKTRLLPVSIKVRSKSHDLETDKCNLSIGDIPTWTYDSTSLPTWTYDGSSTGETGNNACTECELVPLAVYSDPFRDVEHDIIVWCQTRAISLSMSGVATSPLDGWLDKTVAMFKTEEVRMLETMFGFEQEFFMMQPNTGMPYGFVPSLATSCPVTLLLNYLTFHFRNKYMPVNGPQGPYYCGVGVNRSTCTEYIEKALSYCRQMGIQLSGFNYEVAPGQAEFQVFGSGIKACHDLVMLRYVLHRLGTEFNIIPNFASVVIKGGKFNNSGCHTNFSTKLMRQPGGLKYITSIIKSMDTKPCDDPDEFENIFGHNVCQRLTGHLETSPWWLYTYGIGTRHTSIRIPVHVYGNKCGYFEDRRPGANVNPYRIAKWLINQVIQYNSTHIITTFNTPESSQLSYDKTNLAEDSDINTSSESLHTVTENINEANENTHQNSCQFTNINKYTNHGVESDGEVADLTIINKHEIEIYKHKPTVFKQFKNSIRYFFS